jgi:hypothetical protein
MEDRVIDTNESETSNLKSSALTEEDASQSQMNHEAPGCMLSPEWITNYIDQIQSDIYVRVVHNLKVLSLISNPDEYANLRYVIEREASGAEDPVYMEKMICRYIWDRVSDSPTTH